ncbi:alpha/beta fold hydrolase [Actinomycetospora sp. TBRC 11914]|uniref:alpha/beta fold hydrolase n=1 Tax=Actinomycetospora sp. TBRC 11914 TaxID=2729387 RepID=UPI00145F3780|nr:alpha/beta hydrolase [Actinomycetospora sp. TBRC 11914]NMO88440.1 alpha/beta hydrolase [Actinomycetospora sp. TBRC 11914]
MTDLRRRLPGAPPDLLRRGGDPPDVVLVPGLGLSVDGWRAPALLLAGRLRIGTAAVALPAHGLPARPDELLDPVSSACRLLERLDALGAGPVVLVGHSASCQVVAEAARRAPDRVRALVLVGPTTDPRAPTWPRLAARWLATAGHERLGQVPLLLRDYPHSGLLTFARAMDAARRHALAPVLAGLDHPVLAVRGPRDLIAPAAWLDDLAALRPGIGAATLPAGGHMLPLTHPHELAEVLVPFLADRADPSS